MYKEQIALGVI